MRGHESSRSNAHNPIVPTTASALNAKTDTRHASLCSWIADPRVGHGPSARRSGLLPQVPVEEIQQFLPRIFVGPGLTFRRAARHSGTFGGGRLDQQTGCE